MVSLWIRRSPGSDREMNAGPSMLLVVAVTACLQASASAAEESRPAESIRFRHVVIDREHPDHPHCKTVGDLSGDGRVDVLAASASGGGLFWYEYPAWSKHRIDSGSFSTDMQAGDVDGDGDLDAIIPRDGTGLAWYENPRPGGDPRKSPWSRHQIDREGAHDLEVGDIDGDGRLDVAARHGETRIYLQHEPKSWRRIRIPTGGRGGTALGDLDGDGDLDIGQNGYWLETPEDKDSTWTRHEIAGGWPTDAGVHIADLNRDGRPDVLLAPAETSGRLAWYESQSPRRGPWTEHVIDADVSHIHTLKTADVDGDGHLDVVTAEMEQSPRRRVSVHFNLGGASKWRHQVVGRTGSHNLRVADIGGDGDMDIVGANHGNHGGATPIDLWENLLREPTPALSLDRWRRHVVDGDRPWRAVFIASADLDGDGGGISSPAGGGTETRAPRAKHGRVARSANRFSTWRPFTTSTAMATPTSWARPARGRARAPGSSGPAMTARGASRSSTTSRRPMATFCRGSRSRASRATGAWESPCRGIGTAAAFRC